MTRKNYTFTTIFPNNKKPMSVDQLMRTFLIPRKWRHFLRTEKQILINEKYLPLNFLVYPGDKIQINLNQVFSNQRSYPASNHLPVVTYEDENVLVINKLAGQKTHPNLFETDTALNDCTFYLKHSAYIVHRLDMLTHGLLLVAKNPAVVPILNRQLVTKTFHRDYYAKVNLNNPIPDTGTITLPIGSDPDDQRKRKVDVNGLKAITHFKVINSTNNKALLKLTLETGRTHQIRVHLSAMGWPIIGDPLYNPNYKNDQNLELEAYHLSFIKPFSFERKDIYLPTKKEL